MNRFFITLIISMQALSLTLAAQSNKSEDFYDGWAFTKKGDTLRGKICYQNSRTGEIFQQDKKIIIIDSSGTKKRYGSDKLVSFSCNGHFFEFISLDPNVPPFMMERIIGGDALMYKVWFKDEMNSSSQKIAYEEVIFIRRKEESQYTEVVEKGFKKTMKEFFAGDEKILELIKTNNWGISDLDKIITAYNNMQ